MRRRGGAIDWLVRYLVRRVEGWCRFDTHILLTSVSD